MVPLLFPTMGVFSKKKTIGVVLLFSPIRDTSQYV